MKKIDAYALSCRGDRLRAMSRPKIPSYNYPGRDEYKALNSLPMTGIATKTEGHTYTGDNMLGISTMHKSNSVPVFDQQDAIDIAKMRRG